MRFIPLVILIGLVGGCATETDIEDPSPFMGCYGTDSFAAKVGRNSVLLGLPSRRFPAHVGKDKHGYYLLVERPIRYRRDMASDLRLTFYNGSGTYFRFSETPPYAVLEIPVLNDDFLKLSKVSCKRVGLL